jgi:hypothetical protein
MQLLVCWCPCDFLIDKRDSVPNFPVVPSILAVLCMLRQRHQNASLGHARQLSFKNDTLTRTWQGANCKGS